MDESVAGLVRIEEEAILHKPFQLEGHDDIVIKPLTVGQMMAVNPYLIALQEEDEGEKICNIISTNDFKQALLIIDKYMPRVINVVEIVIGEDKCKDLTPDEILILFVALVKRIQTNSFLNSIILMQRMSLNSKEGIIASQKYITG